jgi:hypothetical protein
MGTIKVSVSDENEEKFRKAAMRIFGHKRGSISKAAEKAFVEWADRMDMEDIKKSEGLGSLLRGKLDNTEQSALDLQNELGEAYEDEVLD